jgi:hypothetical protein
MAAKQLIPKTDLETAEVNVRSAEAQIKSSEASLVQAKAQLNNQKVNLGYTTIVAPIDGIVISRNVDQGQTVQSSMNAPTLYVIAADLTKMQVLANIDEADVGRMRPGQRVTFRVDAFPTDTFVGSVAQVRLQPAVVQNVVTYSTVISVPNPELKLKPGMTANVNIEIARRNGVLRIPNAATRFRPTPEMFQVLNQAIPPELERGGRGGRRGEGMRGGNAPGATPGGTPATPPAGPTAGTPPAPAAAVARPAAEAQRPPASVEARQASQNPAGGQGRPAAAGQPGSDGGGQRTGDASGGRGGRGGFDPNMTPEEREERRKRMEERMAQMTPEERTAFQERMKARGGFAGGGNAPGRFGGNREGGGGRGMGPGGERAGAGAQAQGASRGGNRTGQGAAPGQSESRTMSSGATTIDSLFAPIQVQETRGTAWQYENKQLKMLRLRLGVSDGSFSEVLNETELPANAEVVTSMTTGLEQRPTTPGQQQGNPLMGPQRGGPGGGGNRGGGGGRGF